METNNKERKDEQVGTWPEQPQKIEWKSRVKALWDIWRGGNYGYGTVRRVSTWSETTIVVP